MKQTEQMKHTDELEDAYDEGFAEGYIRGENAGRQLGEERVLKPLIRYCEQHGVLTLEELAAIVAMTAEELQAIDALKQNESRAAVPAEKVDEMLGITDGDLDNADDVAFE